MCDAIPFSEGGVIRLDVALLTDPDLSTSDLHSDQREALLQGPSVHDGFDIKLATEPLLQIKGKAKSPMRHEAKKKKKKLEAFTDQKNKNLLRLLTVDYDLSRTFCVSRHLHCDH